MKASLIIYLYVECVDCGEEFDLMGSPFNDEGEFSIPITNNNWGKINEIVECPGCGTKLLIDEIEY